MDRRIFRIRIAWALQFALEGRHSEAAKEMDQEVLKYAALPIDEISAVVEFYAVLGETEKAIEWLDRAVRNGDERSQWIRRDRSPANIREQPRFKQILDSIASRRQQRRGISQDCTGGTGDSRPEPEDRGAIFRRIRP